MAGTGKRTDEALSELGVALEFLAMVAHSLAHDANGQNFILVLALATLRHGFDVRAHGFLVLFHTLGIEVSEPQAEMSRKKNLPA